MNVNIFRVKHRYMTCVHVAPGLLDVVPDDCGRKDGRDKSLFLMITNEHTYFVFVILYFVTFTNARRLENLNSRAIAYTLLSL